MISSIPSSVAPKKRVVRASPAASYELIASAPAVPPVEVEAPSGEAIEVVISWGDNVLHVAHLAPARAFRVGEPELHLKRSVDFVMPAEVLGSPLVELIEMRDGRPYLCWPSHASGCVDTPDQGRRSLLEALTDSGGTTDTFGLSALPLSNSMKVHLWLGSLEVAVGVVRRGKRLAGSWLDSDALAMAQASALTFASFAGFFASLAYFVPPLGLTDEESIQKKRTLLVQQYLAAAAEREKERIPEASAEAPSPDGGGSGEAHAGESGALGTQKSLATNKRYAVQGSPDNADPHLARRAALAEAKAFGMIGMLNPGPLGSLGPISPFGRDTALGLDTQSANGAMWGDEIGDAAGHGGMGLFGIGEGGGGPGRGVGMDFVGTLGHGQGNGPDQGFGPGFGRGVGRNGGGSHGTRAPRVRTINVSVSGRLPGEVIQRIVRQNFGRFRLCYEGGLRRNPNLEGRITVRFAIGRDGGVATAQLGGSDLPDSSVASCVVSAFYGLGFPSPDGGIVTVSYPIVFSPE